MSADDRRRVAESFPTIVSPYGKNGRCISIVATADHVVFSANSSDRWVDPCELSRVMSYDECEQMLSDALEAVRAANIDRPPPFVRTDDETRAAKQQQEWAEELRGEEDFRNRNSPHENGEVASWEKDWKTQKEMDAEGERPAPRRAS